MLCIYVFILTACNDTVKESVSDISPESAQINISGEESMNNSNDSMQISPDNKTVDTPDKRASDYALDIINSVSFSSELTELDKDALPNFFNVNESVEASVYLANGGASDMVCVFCQNGNDSKESIRASVDDYIQGIRDNAILYSPEDVSKIDLAIIQEYGDYVVAIICPDAEKAKKTIDDIFKINS